MIMTYVCQAPKCGKAADYRCPKCKELNIEPEKSYFCNMDCFKAGWDAHKQLHKSVKDINYLKIFEGYKFTGPLRPGIVTPRVTITDPMIKKPDYAEHGTPVSEHGNRNARIIPLNDNDVKGMRKCGIISGKIMELCESMVKPGVATAAIDEAAHNAIVAEGAYPSPLNYKGFKKSICTSVNEVVCHGIPDSRQLQEGDIVNCDVSVFLDGYHTDVNGTFIVGKTDSDSERVVKCARECLKEAFKVVRPGVMYREVGDYISKVARHYNCSVVKSYCGHGVGKDFHCAPSIPHYANNKVWPDQWTSVTQDGKRSAQFEHTVIVTETGCEIITVHKKDYLFELNVTADGVPGSNIKYNALVLQ